MTDERQTATDEPKPAKKRKKPGPTNWRNVRRLYQLFFFFLFLGLLGLASFRFLKSFPVSLYLEADPLLALGSLLSSHVLFKGMALSLIVVVITLIFGRVFCSWICPLGILNHVMSALPSVLKKRARMLKNEWRPIYQTKYYVLIAFLVLAVFGVLQVGLMDPIALTVRSFAVLVFPSLQMVGAPIYAVPPSFLGGWFIGILFVVILASNRFVMRLWCRMLCPLGALLGLISKFSLFRIYKDPKACVSCHACTEACHGACNPHDRIRTSDCVMCLNCIYACSQSGLKYGFLPDPASEALAPDLTRRKTIAAVAGGVALMPALRTSHGVEKGADHDVIRPPGSLSEEDFAKKCVKCGACIKVCPTQVIQPAALEAGFEGLWTPILRYDIGSCTHTCTLCSQVCPTGAIRPITPQDRVGSPPETEPIKLGTAFFDRGRCLPWAMATPCIVCEEVCPTSPKAIWVEDTEVKKSDGTTIKVKLPYLDPTRCIGCGICQNRCPVGRKAAIRVSSVGETRSPENQILIKSY
jgi:polyferredoxin